MEATCGADCETARIPVMCGAVPVRARGGGDSVQFGFFIARIFLKKYVAKQGENFPRSCKVLALAYHKPNGNKILETQRIGYFSSFLFLNFPNHPP